MFGRQMTMKEIKELESKGTKVFGDTKSFTKNKEGEEIYIVSQTVRKDGSVCMY